MKRRWAFVLFVMIVGSLNHFLYAWTGGNSLAALIAPVNESIWEHMKLLFFPFLAATVAEYILRRPEGKTFFLARLAGVWAGILFTICAFYIYSGILGRSYVPVDIGLFLVSVLVAFWVADKAAGRIQSADPAVVWLLWLASALLFFLFTCYPPDIGLFTIPSNV